MILINTGCKAVGKREAVKIFKYLGKILQKNPSSAGLPELQKKRNFGHENGALFRIYG
jgi:hypothetical protein